jgi:hypothetical protein
MPREPIDYDRRTAVRNPAIFHVAVEGEKTEVHYFTEINRKLQDSRFQVSIVSRPDPSFSAPKHVLQSVLDHIGKNSLKKDDQLWIVIDRDKWPVAQLDEVAAVSGERGVQIAFSNPCFELWMLLHHRTVQNLEEIRKLNTKRRLKEKMVAELRTLLGQYSQNTPDMDAFFVLTDVAVKNARAITPIDRIWFEEAGTTMHKLISALENQFT